MNQLNKYNAQKIFYDVETGKSYQRRPRQKALQFNSMFELTVYKALVSLVGESNVIREVPLLIKPRTKQYGAIYWKCDFRVFKPFGEPKEDYINVEAKGIPTREFKRNMKFLEYFSRDEYEHLMIIAPHPTEFIDYRIEAWNVGEALGYLKTQSYCLQKVKV